jgi:hypothetical protein
MTPTIEEIKVNLDSLNKELVFKTDKTRYAIIRKYVGGVCTLCKDIPVKKISYDIGGALFVEFYCQKCFTFYKDGRSKEIIDKLN